MSKYQPFARTAVSRLRIDLDALFLRCDGIDQTEEVVGDLNRYLCVRVAGFLERALVECARSYCSSSAWGGGLNFSLSWLDRGPNPRADEIVRMVNRFDRTWANDLQSLLGDDDRGTRINSLLGIRNDIAHGKNQGVSRTQAWEYYSLVNEVITWLLERFDPK